MGTPAPDLSTLFEHFKVSTLTSFVTAIKCRFCRRLVSFTTTDAAMQASHRAHSRLCLDRRQGDRRKADTDRRHALAGKFPPIE